MTTADTQILPASENRLQPCRDTDTVAVDGALLYDHVAEIDSDTEYDSLLVRRFRVALGHSLAGLQPRRRPPQQCSGIQSGYRRRWS
jgi:hypothetical protein